MTEIPEHLLARSKARRQAIGQDAGGGEAPATAGAVEPAASAPPAAATGPAAAAAPTPAKAPTPAPPPPPKPPRPEVAAALNRRKIPWWAVPAVAGLPVWAAIYAFTLEPPTVESLVATEGGELYGTYCSSCHGATGGGGVGPQLAGGAVVETFSNPQDHVDWVMLGSLGWQAERGPTYGDTAKPVLGFSNAPMPGFADRLSDEEIALIVRYEREILSGAECDPDLATLSGEPCEE